MSIDKELLDIMACLECRSSLEDHESHLVCTGCGLHYPVRDGVPHMLAEEAYRPEAGDA